MKKQSIRNKGLIYCLLLSLLCSAGVVAQSTVAAKTAKSSQAISKEQFQTTKQKDKKKALQTLAKREHKNYLKMRARIQQMAKAKNLAIQRIDPNGNLITLEHIDEHGHPYYVHAQNLNAIQTISADKVKRARNQGGYGLTGNSVTLGIWDQNSVRITHREFGGRARVQDGTTTHSSHATHVAGTMIAAGIDANAEGVASGANLESYSWSNDFAEMATAAVDTTPLHCSNHSYGFVHGWNWDNQQRVWRWYGNLSISRNEDWRFGAYTSVTQMLDSIAFLAPYYLIVMAAGNDRSDVTTAPHRHGSGNQVFTDSHQRDGGADGFDCIGLKKTAKNILTVGAVNDVPGGYQRASDVTATNFTSFGPTDDGRIKPDVVANGMGVFSTDNRNDQDYSSKNGTSMATPSVSGLVGLLLEHWKSMHDTVPLSSTMKALLIHTADEAGSDDGPDYRFGWGLVNGKKAADLIQQDNDRDCAHIMEDALGVGQRLRFPVVVGENADFLRATIVWNDPPSDTLNTGTLNPTVRRLVNNLNIRIKKDNQNWKPWVLDPTKPGDKATQGNNDRDNVEQVHIKNPAAGEYFVEVYHDGVLIGEDQPFSLIISGNDGRPNSLTFNDKRFEQDRVYHAGNTITVEGTSSVAESKWVEMRAGQRIILKPGMTAGKAVRFRATIIDDPCEKPVQ
ncbi:MAG: S8 family serine peptidase [Saprospiraceae bacterium]|nr:S8 family serine peptidase [Saprospiraceae bacterium]